MKLGQKIGGGFALITLIALALGLLSITKMRTSSEDTHKLANGYAPEADYASSAERHLLKAMTDNIAYSYSEDNEFYKKGQQELSKIVTYLDQLEELANTHDFLKGLDKTIATSKSVIADYNKNVKKTRTLIEERKSIRKDMDAAATVFTESADVFLRSQEQGAKNDIDERKSKISLSSDILIVVNEARVTNFKAQADNNPALMDEAIDLLRKVPAFTKELKELCKLPEDIERIDGITKNAQEYAYQISLAKGTLSKGIGAIPSDVRSKMDSAASELTTLSKAFLKNQETLLTQDVDTRLTKIKLASTIEDLGSNARINNFKAQATNNIETLNIALESTEAIVNKIIPELLQYVKLQEDMDSLNNLKNATLDYQNAVARYMRSWSTLNEVSRARMASTEEAQKVISAVGSAAVEDSKNIAVKANNELTAASEVITIGLIVSIIIAVIISVFITRKITGPIKQVVSMVKEVAQGDLTHTIEVSTKDEVGELATAINEMSSSLRKIMGELVENAAALSSASEELSATSNELASSSEEMTSQANTVASASEELSVNMSTMTNTAQNLSSSSNTVAAGIEEMSASIREVAQNCSKESQIADQANRETEQTRTVMKKLGASAHEIGKVVELISNIADQTNLLALNATIEAASAGEAGKGFAVVANEVKELARQTAEATGQISKLINEIQGNTSNSVDAIEKVSTIIQQVYEISHSIAATVEEQSATSNEMSENMSNISRSAEEMAANIREGATGSSEVSKNISGISMAAHQVSSGASQTTSASRELSGMASQLRGITQRFKV